MKIIRWILLILLGLVLLVGLPALFFFGNHWVGGARGMMGPWMMGRGFYFNSPLGWIFMLIRWLVPLAVLFLIVAGGIWLFNSLTKTGRLSSVVQTPQPAAPTTSQPVAPTAVAKVCASCGKPIQEDWKVCPYCGSTISL